MTGSEDSLSEPSPRAEDAWHYPWADTEMNKTARFLTSLTKSKVETTKCKKCSTVQWPPRSICSNCLSLDLSWVALPKKGTLVSFSRAYIGAAHGEEVPITVGAIHLQGGFRLLGRITGASYDSLKTGMTVTLAGAKLVDGKPYWEFTTRARSRR